MLHAENDAALIVAPPPKIVPFSKEGGEAREKKKEKEEGEEGGRAEREHVPWLGGVLVLSTFLPLLLLGHVAPLGPNLVHILLRAPPARHRAETARSENG